MRNVASASIMMRRMSALSRTRLQPQMGMNVLPNNLCNVENSCSIVYFIKLCTGKVDITGQVVNDGMTRCLNFGMTESQFLMDLKLMLRELYIPALQREGGTSSRKQLKGVEGEDGEEGGGEEEGALQDIVEQATEEAKVHKCFESLPQHIYDEIHGSTTKFMTQVHQAAMQVYGIITLRQMIV